MVSDEEKSAFQTKRALALLGWAVKNEGNMFGLISQNGDVILKLNKTHKFTQEEMYALRVLLAIDNFDYSYNTSVKAYDKMKDLQNGMLQPSLEEDLKSQLEEIAFSVKAMYYHPNWETLKPILKKIISTIRQDSKVFTSVYSALEKRVDKISPTPKV